MKNSILILLIAVSLSSCVTSLQPLVSPESAITIDRIEGNWENTDGDYKVYRFFKSDVYNKLSNDINSAKGDTQSREQKIKDSIRYSKGYIIEFTRKNIQHFMFGSFIRLNGNLFINLTPVKAVIVNDTSEVSIDPVASFGTNSMAKVQLICTNKLQLDFIDGDFLYKQIVAGKMKLKHEREDLYDTFLITASTADLQQFLVKYGNDLRFFNKENSIILNRKS